MSPIIIQCLNRLDESLKNVDSDGYVRLRAESAVMIRTWLESLEIENQKLKEGDKNVIG